MGIIHAVAGQSGAVGPDVTRTTQQRAPEADLADASEGAQGMRSNAQVPAEVHQEAAATGPRSKKPATTHHRTPPPSLTEERSRAVYATLERSAVPACYRAFACVRSTSVQCQYD